MSAGRPAASDACLWPEADPEAVAEYIRDADGFGYLATGRTDRDGTLAAVDWRRWFAERRVATYAAAEAGLAALDGAFIRAACCVVVLPVVRRGGGAEIDRAVEAAIRRDLPVFFLAGESEG